MSGYQFREREGTYMEGVHHRDRGDRVSNWAHALEELVLDL
jgi:hypothetical protein